MMRLVNDVNSLNDLLTNGLINVINDFIMLIANRYHVQYECASYTGIVSPVAGSVAIMFGLRSVIRERWQIVRQKNSNMNACRRKHIRYACYSGLCAGRRE